MCSNVEGLMHVRDAPVSNNIWVGFPFILPWRNIDWDIEVVCSLWLVIVWGVVVCSFVLFVFVLWCSCVDRQLVCSFECSIDAMECVNMIVRWLKSSCWECSWWDSCIVVRCLIRSWIIVWTSPANACYMADLVTLVANRLSLSRSLFSSRSCIS